MISELQELLKPELNALGEVIQNHYKKSKIELIHQVVENLVGGKRIRPVLMLALGKLFGCHDVKMIHAAAAIELIHTATLLHDDVVDGAEMRRNAKTAKSIWGNKTSILVGDFLLSAAFNSAIACESMTVLEILSGATLVIAEGEVKQLINTDNINLKYETYLEIISAKTAKLFEAACEISGALIGEDIDLLGKFGHALGMAFQITDDVLDYFPSSGKDQGKDFISGRVTLPIIIAYKEAPPQEKVFWEGSRGNLEKALRILEKHNALQRSLGVAKSYTNTCDEITKKTMPPSKVKTLIRGLLKFITERDR